MFSGVHDRRKQHEQHQKQLFHLSIIFAAKICFFLNGNLTEPENISLSSYFPAKPYYGL
jgi:hypothetical protein